MNIEMSKAEEEEARLTAYVLGELGADETKEVEAQLEGSAEMRKALEEIRSTADLLSAEFLKEPALSLHEEQVEAITSPPAEENVVRGKFMPLMAVAACACLFAAVGMKDYLAGLEDRELAEHDRMAAEGTAAPAVKPGLEEVEDEVEVLEEAVAKLGKDARGAKGEKSAGSLAEDVVVASNVRRKEVGDEHFAGAPDPAAPMEAPTTTDKGAAQAPLDAAMADLKAPAGGGAGAKRQQDAFTQPKADGASLADRLPTESAAPVAKTKPRMVAKPEPVPGAVANSVPPVAEASVAAAPTPAPASVESKANLSEETRRNIEQAKMEIGRIEAKKKEFAARPSRAANEEARALSDSVRRKRGINAAPDAVERDVEELIAGAPQEESLRIVPRRGREDGDGESYGALVDNPWVAALQDGRSTFAIDVDTGTYPNVRRFLQRRGKLPPRDAVRIEEMINYFEYAYPEPEGNLPFSVDLEVASCPWAKDHRLLKIGLKGREVETDKRPPSNLVFLIDVSGSMRDANKLALLKTSMKKMVGQLNEDDRIGIVTYSGSSGVALEPTHGDLQDKIIGALDKLRAGGSTNGAAGITTAYSLAKANFVPGGTNRVILATDGDFNVGVTDSGDLIQMIEQHAEQKIFLTVLGFGEGNLKEHRMEQIADKGNGSYHYIDSEKEGEKVLVDGLGATLVTVAKDVKIQVEFNPAQVAKYRLIGYANRMLPDQAFNDPAADAGEIGAGHTATALYEIVPTKAGGDVGEGAEAGSRYRKQGELIDSPELLAVSLKYKLPEAAKEDDSEEPIVVPLVDGGKQWPETGEDFRFAAAVAGFGMLLRDSDYAGLLNYDLVLELAGEGLPEDGDKLGLRGEFMDLVKAAKSLSPAKD